jgi:membrane-associated progesterone receptor component
MDAGQAAQSSGGGKAIVEESAGFVMDLYNEISSSPINIALLVAILVLVYKIFKGRSDNDGDNGAKPDPPLPKMKKQDMTLQELRKYDGIQGEGRVLCAINGRVFDVTKGKRFYGPGKKLV